MADYTNASTYLSAPIPGVQQNDVTEEANQINSLDSALELLLKALAGPDANVIVSGCTIAIGAGLSVDIAAGSRALIGGRHVYKSTALNVPALTASQTNYIYLTRPAEPYTQAFTASANITGVVPANSILIATCVCGGASVTSVNNNVGGRAPVCAEGFLRPRAQTTPDMTIYVERGSAIIDGVRVEFGGGSSPIITAPVTNPRIDLITLDSAGTLAVTAGTEGATPAAPTFPNNALPIALVYLKTTSTSIQQTSSSNVLHGYLYREVLPWLRADPVPWADQQGTVGTTTKRWGKVYAAQFGLSASDLLSFSAGALYVRLGASWGTAFGAAAVYPYANLGQTLGTSSRYWSAAYLGHIYVLDAKDLILSETTGTKIGTAAAQKLGFWNATPVVQPSAVADATDAASVILRLNELLARIRTIGLIAT